MCGWALNSSLAAIPARSTILAKPAGVKGAPRSETNRNGPGELSRCSRRKALISSPRIGWVAGVGERGGEEVHLLPAQVHDLGSPQACRKHGGVAPLAVWPPWAAVHVTASTTRASLHGKKTSLKDGKTDSRIALNGLSAAGGRGLFCVAQYATALQNRSCTGIYAEHTV